MRLQFVVAISISWLFLQSPATHADGSAAQTDLDGAIQSLFINNPRIGPVFSKEQRDLVAGDLERLSKIKGDGANPGFHQIFGPGNLDGQRYVRRFLKHVSTIYPDLSQRVCGRTAGACAEPGIFDLYKAIWLDPDYFEEDQWQRLAYLIHEERHLEGQYHDVSCDPSITATKECDDYATGAYGTEATFMLNVARYCTNCTKLDKLEAWSVGIMTVGMGIKNRDLKQRFLEKFYNLPPGSYGEVLDVSPEVHRPEDGSDPGVDPRVSGSRSKPSTPDVPPNGDPGVPSAAGVIAD